jgi:hypothetical protein
VALALMLLDLSPTARASSSESQAA